MTAQLSGRFHGLSLPRAALVTGVGLLVVTVTATFSQFVVFPDLVVPGEVDRTLRNIDQNRGLFTAGIWAYLINYVADIVVTLALYVLLYPVSRALSLLVLLVRVVYIAMAMVALLNYVEVFRLLGPGFAAVLGSEQLDVYVYTLLNSYQFDWGFSLVVFGISLLVQGYLVYRATYIPAVLGVLLAIAGLGYIVYEMGVFFFPGVGLDFLIVTFLAEPVFMVWLLWRWRRIEEPGAGDAAGAAA